MGSLNTQMLPSPDAIERGSGRRAIVSVMTLVPGST